MHWLEEDLSALRIREELLKEGLQVGYSTVKDYVSCIKKQTKVFLRIHSAPGEEAQVDFDYTLDNKGNRRKTWIFNIRLSYSRLDFYKKVYDQKV